MLTCIFCHNELTENTKPEHILLNALGGRKTTRGVDCSECNGRFGSTIDKALAEQVPVLRNLLGMTSGQGKPPPAIRNVKAGNDTINLNNDGSLDLVQKPFSLIKNTDGTATLSVNAKSFDEIAKHIPNIAAMLGRSEDEVVALLQNASGTIVSRRPGMAYFPMSFGGEEAVRSLAKSCLVFWATLVGNEEMQSSNFTAAREFVVTGSDAFNRARVHLDPRPLPHEEKWIDGFGQFFNLIYLRSDAAGRLIGHFTLYNALSWHVVLAEGGATPNKAIALASDPINPATWSDGIADEIDIPLDWLESRDDTDQFHRARSRLSAAVERSQQRGLSQELDAIIRGAFEKNGITEGAAVTDPAVLKRIIREISHRAALHIMSIPHEEAVEGDQIVKAILDARHHAGDSGS